MKPKSSIKQRILQYIDYKGITKYEFYKTTGITRGILDQPNGITESNIIKFINTFNEIDIVWLITGVGNVIKPPPNLFDSDTHRSHLIEKSINSRDPNHAILTKIPVVPIEYLSSYLDRTQIPKPIDFQTNFIETVFNDADFYTRVRDLSLFPLFNSGDVIACKIIQPEDFIQWNKVYLLSTSQGIIVKRILQGKDENHLKLVSDNPTFLEFEISRQEIYAMAIIRGSVHLE